MRKIPLGRSLFVALLSLGLAACASTGGAAGGEVEEGVEATGDEVTVQVVNDMVPGRTIVVWVETVPQRVSRRRLGSVPPNATRDFKFSPRARDIDHQLTAEIEGGGSETSLPFSLLGVSGVRWALSNPTVSLAR
ncbi:MAG: hypothetical protein JSW46_02350 [Gemmatimonadota bacterium]|nr:MAG: hypothetical protein JSW46_02350 [Gemmatimonadota bacterium]